MSRMRRRKLLNTAAEALAGLALPALLPLRAWAQAAARIPKIGLIGDQGPAEPRIEAFRQGMRDLGYVHGKNILIEERHAHGVTAKFPELVAELLRLKVELLVVGPPLAVQAAKAQAVNLPIVFTTAADPVGSGLVADLAHPGGNLTGLSTMGVELSGKQLELLKSTVPRATRFTLLCNPTSLSTRLIVLSTREAARTLGLDLQVIETRRAGELTGAFAAMTAGRSGAVVIASDAMFGNELVQLATLAAVNRMPAIYNRREFALAGGLLSYGPNFSDIFRRAASYVDKILKGAKPGDLPVEQPTRFDMVINMKTAKALGIVIPQTLLLRATEVIE